ncbi:T9SS type A sorting domain-containing protein [Flammeovirga pectinis]|uniref:T9SS type A sorting domain-containing protein n=1 Tax=Flammeovirga pectinis TaxID=2494373 RepID=A0A3S9P695_9BACT|nr:fibronectin type III domain-containing protein [Flammeovirga pectinis]AZQ63731.1 T9SS type A sorting domain-containing protein [Flammeovirga pectinis]
MRNFNNIINLCLLFLLGTVSVYAQQTDTPHTEGNEGVYVFQATEYFSNNAGSNSFDGEVWVQGTDEVVGDYMYLENTSSDNRNETSAERGDSPSLTYKINMESAQKGFVWALINEGAKDAGRIYVNMNDLDLDKREADSYGSAAKSRISDEMKGQWQWILLNNQANDNIVISGDNTIEFFKARPDIKIAKIAFTPIQELNMIINAPMLTVTENDGTNLTITIGDPSLTGELYDFEEVIYDPKNYFYRVQVGGELINDAATENTIVIPLADLTSDVDVEVQVGHQFRKNSSSNLDNYSLTTTLTVNATSQPEESEEEGGLEPTTDPHIADANGIYMFSATEFAENKEGSAFGAQDFSGEKWVKGTDEVIGDYMYLENTDSDNRNETSSERAASPSLVFKINMESAKTGFVWALINEGSKDAGRIYVNMNDLDLDKREADSYGSAAKSRISDEMKGQWQWILLNNQANDNIVISGDNTIEFFKARPDIKIAKIAFTPIQELNMIINAPMLTVTENDGTNLTITIGDPSLTGELYDFEEVIYDPKNYFYRVQVGGELINDAATENTIVIPLADLTSDVDVEVQVGHQFRKNSSSNLDNYSLTTTLTVNATSQPEESEEEEGGLEPTTDPHIADANGIYMFSATEFAENKEGSAFGAQDFSGEKWVKGTDEVIGDYMYLENTDSDNRNETSSERAASPSLVFKINMESAKTGFVWALINEGSKDAGRIYVNMNDLDLDKREADSYGSAAKSRISDHMKGEWQWILINNQANDKVVIDGDNTIEIFKARPNIKIAKIAFTPQQDINLIIDTKMPSVTDNDGTNLTIGWDEPTLTGDVYDNTDAVFTTKSYYYRVKLGEEVIGDNITTRTIQIPLTNLTEAKIVTVEVGHEFKKNSSGTHATYSIPGEITVDANSQPSQGEDNEAPTKPSDLASSDITQNSITLSWTAATDNIGVVGYKIKQDGGELSSRITDGTSTTISGLQPETEYSFSVIAYDAAGNDSEMSDVHTVSTIAVPTNPDGEYQDFIHQADGEGVYQFDAVEFASNLPGSDAFDGQKWLVGTDEVVGKYLYLENTDTTTNVNKVSADRMKSPSLSYKISMPTVQTGFIWALINQGEKNGGKIYGSVNGIDVDKRTEGEYGAAFGSRISGDLVGKWQWVLVGYQIRNNNATMLKEGINEIAFFMGYPNIKIAKVIYAPKQEILPIINAPKIRIQANDETTVTVSWEEPVLTGELYDNVPQIINPKDYTYRVKLEGQDEEEIKEREYVINKEDLKGGKAFTVEIGHQFRKNSSGTALFFSLPASIPVTEDSQADFEAPTTPADLTSVDTQGTNVALSWTASTDNIGVIGYNIFQDGIKIQEVQSTSYKVAGLTPSTSYSFEVQAYDLTGNVSEKSTPLVLTTNSKDEIIGDRPNIVSELSASQITANSFTVSWKPSNSLNGINAYYVFLKVTGAEGDYKMVAELNGETFSFNLTDLEVGTSYDVIVRAEDGEGFLSEESSVFTQITLDTPLSVVTNSTVKLIQSVYPNPSVNDINIEFSTEVTYQVYDLTGYTVIEGSARNLKVNLVSGTYILVAIDKNGNKEVTKLMCF